MEWIHWQLCGTIILGAYILDITSANTFTREDEFRHFSLYSFTTQGESWQRAYDACNSEGLQLAVLDKQDQDILDTWKVLINNTGGNAWLAGRRLEDSGWMWVNSGTFVGGISSLSEDTEGRCGIIQGGLLKSARCVGQRGNDSRGALCQNQNGGGSSYTLSLEALTSWFAARMECRSQPGRDMAHVQSGQSEEEFLLDSDIANMTADDRTRGVWVGVCRNCWSWVTGSQTSPQPMDYFHFAKDQGDNDGEDCLHLELGGVSALHWADKACKNTSKYFVCEQKSYTTKTTRVTTLSSISAISSGQNTEDNRSSDPQATPGTTVGGSSTPPDVPSRQVLLLAILVPSVVVVTLVIVATILAIRRRRAAIRGHKEHETSSTPDISPYAEINSDVTNPPSTGAHEDSTHSNDVMDTGNTRASVGEGQVRGPSGDVYALPAGLQRKDRKSDHLEMQDNATYGGW